MTETPFGICHVRFYEDAFERFTGSLAFGFKSFAQETVDAGPVIEPGYRAALRAFRRTRLPPPWNYLVAFPRPSLQA